MEIEQRIDRMITEIDSLPYPSLDALKCVRYLRFYKKIVDENITPEELVVIDSLVSEKENTWMHNR